MTVPTTNPASGPDARSGYVPVNGLDMYYEIHGEGSPLALFHGAMGTINSCFADLLPALAATRQVVAIELQGHGHTADIDRPLSYRQMAADAAALLEALGIEMADLVGYSLGGAVALELAMQHPGRVRRLVLRGRHLLPARWPLPGNAHGTGIRRGRSHRFGLAPGLPAGGAGSQHVAGPCCSPYCPAPPTSGC